MKLSIITINFNNKAGLQKTIDSVISQTYKDIEWIIIDGGSTDGSKELIEQYAEYITYWVSEPDKGIYNAMNKGILVAKGEYCLFLNSGDGLVSQSVLKNVFRRNLKTDFITGNLILLSNPIRRIHGIHSDNVTCANMICGTIFHPTTFIKRVLFDKYGKYDENLKIVSDWKFFFYCLIIKNCTIKYINEDIAFYNTEGISSTQKSKVRAERNVVLSEYLPLVVLEDYKFTIRESYIQKYTISRKFNILLYKIVGFYENLRYKHFQKKLPRLF